MLKNLPNGANISLMHFSNLVASMTFENDGQASAFLRFVDCGTQLSNRRLASHHTPQIKQ